MTVSLENYRWNNKVEFDAHRSMTLGLINLNQKEIVGHITFMIDKDYLVDSVLRPKLMNQFGDTENSGMVVWLRDWMQNEVLISSNENYQLERGLVDIRQRFHDMLGDWILYASYLESPTVAAAKASVNRNLLLLGIAVIILFGALVFMFINAQKEREFAQRQAGFLANITHELKTPLAVMQAAGENISDGRVTEGERLKNYGEHIYRESIRLRKMIDKLLDVARVDAGETVVEQSPQDLNAFLSEYHKTNREFVESKGFTFNLESEDRLPLVMVDRDHLETILNNLVENSLKYSNSEKEITIQSSYDGQNQVEISVTDKGEGIATKVQKNIFDKFFRAENAMTAHTKGHGLGLSIVKNLVELNGGRISVSSRSGDGSTFTLSFKPLPHPPNHYQRDHKVAPSSSTKTEVEEHV
jgi:signal transduction histidine kinase